MGFPIIYLNCTRCGYRQHAQRWQAFVYRLDGGEELPVRTTSCWCSTCNAARQCEDLAPASRLASLRLIGSALSSIEHERNWFSSRWTAFSTFPLDEGARGAFDMDTARRLGANLLEISRELAYLDARTDLPRCLTCEGTDLVANHAIGVDGHERLLHDGCGGLLMAEIVGNIRMSPPQKCVLDSHGRAISSPG